MRIKVFGLLGVATAGLLLLGWFFVTSLASATPATGLNYTSPTIGTLLYVPPGRFQRDGTASNISVITHAYRMSKYEITVAQFQAIMDTDISESNCSATDAIKPAYNVNWYHAIAFCNKLSIREGLKPVYSVRGITDWAALPFASIPTTNSNVVWDTVVATWTNNGYRLPTEMEWMWAAMGAPADGRGGGTNTTGYLKGYAGSIEGAGRTNIGNFAWYRVNSGEITHPVGTKLANELGLHDMSGNVWEWCWDSHGAYPAGILTDYRGATLDAGRVVRGGGWNGVALCCAVASRSYSFSRYEFKGAGFRVVRP